MDYKAKRAQRLKDKISKKKSESKTPRKIDIQKYYYKTKFLVVYILINLTLLWVATFLMNSFLLSISRFFVLIVVYSTKDQTNRSSQKVTNKKPLNPHKKQEQTISKEDMESIMEMEGKDDTFFPEEFKIEYPEEEKHITPREEKQYSSQRVGRKEWPLKKKNESSASKSKPLQVTESPHSNSRYDPTT